MYLPCIYRVSTVYLPCIYRTYMRTDRYESAFAAIPKYSPKMQPLIFTRYPLDKLPCVYVVKIERSANLSTRTPFTHHLHKQSYS